MYSLQNHSYPDDPILEWLSRVPHLDHLPDCDGGEDIDRILTDLCGDETTLKTRKKIFTIVRPGATQTEDTMTKQCLRILGFNRA
jgi:hypothetical protein